MEDDGLYDFLPEVCDLDMDLEAASSAQEMDISSNIDERNIVSHPFKENLLTVSNMTCEDRKQRSLERCTCSDSVQWGWEQNDKCTFVELYNQNRDVRFHRNQSNGTAHVRCTEPMSMNQYYCEVKITHPVYGTDVMLGVGTSDVEVKDIRAYVNLLGDDDKTWGLSYTGFFKHNKVCKSYTHYFRQGDVIGLHLDLWRGTLSFYRNRENLGIATSGLKGKTLYAMASSTATYSGMRIIRSCSFPSSLQFLCCSKLRELIPSDKNVLDVLNFPPGLKQFLKTNLNWLLSKQYFDGSDVCSYHHTENTCEDIVDESNMGRMFFDLSNRGLAVYINSVLNRNCGQVLLEQRNEEQGNRIRIIHNNLNYSSLHFD